MIRRFYNLFFGIPIISTVLLIVIFIGFFLPERRLVVVENSKNIIDIENLNSLIRIKIEADISPDLRLFTKNNLEQINHYGAMSAAAVNIQIANNQSLIFVFTRVRYSKVACFPACQPDRSFLYAQVLTNDYHQTTYTMNLANGEILRFPSILNISTAEVNECCLGPEDPRIVVTENNQILISFNMIDVDKKRKIWFYDIFNRRQVPATISDHSLLNVVKNWSPFIKDNKLYFIYSYNPLRILQCSAEQGSCHFILKNQTTNQISSLRGGTQLVRFRNTNYYVGIARTKIFCQKCQRFYRPHLFILSTIDEQFRIVYVSEPLLLDNIPTFAFEFMTGKRSNKDFCDSIIRIMTPGSIVSWKWPEDKLIFTLSINDIKSYLVSITGFGNVVENIISKIQKNNVPTNEIIVSRSESLAIKYCETISETNKWISDKIQMIQQYPKEKIIGSNLTSPTYPQFELASNTQREVLSVWITADAVNFGLLGRYLLENRTAHLMIDAGGNHGTYGFYAAALNQSVCIFEILLDYWIVIQESIRLNPQFNDRATLYPFGVGNQYQQWTIIPGAGITRLDSVQSQSINNSNIIHVYPLDDLIFQSVSVLKIDVEGFEIRTLQGAQQLISKFGVGAILIEVASKRWSWYNVSMNEGISVLEQVTAIGHYSVYIIARNDGACPASVMASLKGITPATNLSMINFQTGKPAIAQNVFHLIEWKTMMIEMEKNDWSCNFWLETSEK